MKTTRFLRAVGLAVVAGVILFLGWCLAEVYRPEEAYTPNNLLRMSPDDQAFQDPVRLRILGNSDDASDQDAKLCVRDALLRQFGEKLMKAGDKGEALAFMQGLMPEIERTASGCLKDRGFAYGAKACIKKASFPETQYALPNGENLHLPSGDYSSLYVVLGEGKGHNWWCVMYPPLCYFDLAKQGEGGDQDGIPTRFRSLLLDAIKTNISKLWVFITSKPHRWGIALQKALNLR